MLKKILLIVLLFCTLSLPALALGNDYTFTRSWWDVVLGNSYTQLTTDGVSSSVNNDSDFTYISINDMFQGDLYNPVPFIYTKPDFISADQVRVHLPINVTVDPGQTITSSFYILYKNNSSSNVGYTSTLLNNTSGGYEATVSVQTVDKVQLGNLVVNGSLPSFNPSFTSSRADYITVTYTNNSSSSIVFHRLMLYFFHRDGTAVPGNSDSLVNTSLYIGVLALNDDVVLLPDSVEKEIINISNGIDTSLNKLDSISAQLQSISQQLASLNVNINTNSSTQNNFYNNVQQSITDTQEFQEAITQAPPEVVEEVEALAEKHDELVSEYNDIIVELDGIQDSIPDFIVEDVSTTLDTALSFYQGSDLANSILSPIGEFPIFSTMIIIVLSFGTIGFIMFGER